MRDLVPGYFVRGGKQNQDNHPLGTPFKESTLNILPRSGRVGQKKSQTLKGEAQLRQLQDITAHASSKKKENCAPSRDRS